MSEIDPIVMPKYLVILILTVIPLVMMGVGFFFYSIKDKGFGIFIFFGGIAFGCIWISIMFSGLIVTDEMLEIERIEQSIPEMECSKLKNLVQNNTRYRDNVINEIIMRCIK